MRFKAKAFLETWPSDLRSPSKWKRSRNHLRATRLLSCFRRRRPSSPLLPFRVARHHDNADGVPLALSGRLSVAPAGGAEGSVTAGRVSFRAAAHAAVVRAAAAVFRGARRGPRIGAGWDPQSEADSYEHHDSPHCEFLSPAPIPAHRRRSPYLANWTAFLKREDGRRACCRAKDFRARFGSYSRHACQETRRVPECGPSQGAHCQVRGDGSHRSRAGQQGDSRVPRRRGG